MRNTPTNSKIEEGKHKRQHNEQKGHPLDQRNIIAIIIPKSQKLDRDLHSNLTYNVQSSSATHATELAPTSKIATCHKGHAPTR